MLMKIRSGGIPRPEENSSILWWVCQQRLEIDSSHDFGVKPMLRGNVMCFDRTAPRRNEHNDTQMKQKKIEFCASARSLADLGYLIFFLILEEK